MKFAVSIGFDASKAFSFEVSGVSRVQRRQPFAGLAAQLIGKRCNAVVDIGAFLHPAMGDHFVVWLIQHRRQCIGRVVIEIQPGLGVGSPGMLGSEAKRRRNARSV